MPTVTVEVPASPRARMDVARDRAALRAGLRDWRIARDRDALAALHRAQRDALTGDALADAASGSRKDREAAAERLAIRQRDEWQRASAAPIPPTTLAYRVAEVAEGITGATDDERSEAVAAVLYRLIRRAAGDGRGVSYADVSARGLRLALTGIVLNDRERAARQVALPDDDADDDADQSDRAARDAAVRRDVWRAFTTDPTAARAAEVPTERLALALAVRERGALTRDALTAAAAALAGYGSAIDVAAAEGISTAAARQRLARGRKALREHYGSVSALALALTDAVALADTSRERAVLTADQRAASAAVDSVKRAYRRPARAVTAPARYEQVPAPARWQSATGRAAALKRRYPVTLRAVPARLDGAVCAKARGPRGADPRPLAPVLRERVPTWPMTDRRAAMDRNAARSARRTG